MSKVACKISGKIQDRGKVLQHERKVSYGNIGPQELVRLKKLAKGRDFYRTVRMREDKREFWTWDLVLSGFYEHRRTGKITYSNETMVDQIKDKCHDPRTCVSDRKRKLRFDLVFTGFWKGTEHVVNWEENYR